jgi:indole-3-glycerol phosphate synthase
VNNRNLDDFSVDITTSLQLAEHIPVEKVKISESGLHSALEVAQLKDAGYDGFLIGSHFMRHPHPEKACADFINALQSQKQTKTA